VQCYFAHLHMNDLKPCLLNPNGAGCKDREEEIAQVFAFRKYISAVWARPSASAALVSFHNLVTASVVNVTNLMGNRRHFYCVKNVLRELPRAYVSDVPTVTWAPTPDAAVKDIPGLAHESKFIDCPP